MVEQAVGLGFEYRPDFGYWWPFPLRKAEKSFEYHARRMKDSDAAIRLSKQRRTAIQAGGFVGLWPLRLAKFYTRVITCEPQAILYECLKRNCGMMVSNVEAHQIALGASPGLVKMLRHPDPARGRVSETGEVVVELRTIDSFKVQDCDAIFLDVEGYETHVLAGAHETIMRCRPVIQVELLPRAKEGINAMLCGHLGYRLECMVGHDGVYVAR